jgi:hypothetical protein
VYRRFDPLGFLSVGNSALSVGLGGVMLWRQINPSNGFFLAVSVAFMVVEELDSSFGAIPAVEHWDVTNDNYLRFQSLFKVSDVLRHPESKRIAEFSSVGSLELQESVLTPLVPVPVCSYI